jgi:glycolate oxidase
MNSSNRDSDQVFSALVEITGEENVTREECDLICYEKDFSLSPTTRTFMPDFAIQIRTAKQASEVLKLANRHKIPIIPRGGGTSPWGGAIPLNGGIVIDMRKMDVIVDLDEKNRTVTVQGGVSIWNLTNHLEKYGYFVADKPETWFSAMIGARTQTDGVGHFNSRYGRFIDQIVRLEVVLPSGEIIKTGPSGVYDPASGYDLTRLFSNAEGTLGIITEVTLRIHPVPEHRAVEVIEFATFEDAVKTVAAIRDSGPVPETLETMDGTRYGRLLQAVYVDADEHYHPSKVSVLRRPPPEVRRDEGIMIVACAGSNQFVEAQKDIIHDMCKKHGGSTVPDWCRTALIAARATYPHNPTPHDNLLMGKPFKYVMDVAVPLERTVDVYKAYCALVEKYKVEPRGVETVYCAPDFSAAMSAQIFVDERDEAEVSLASKIVDELHRFVMTLGGGIGGVSGLGSMLSRYAEDQHGQALELMKKIKRLLDPNNIMNPGKKFG